MNISEKVNYYATVVTLLERHWKEQKDKDDDLFNDAIFAGMMEAW